MKKKFFSWGVLAVALLLVLVLAGAGCAKDSEKTVTPAETAETCDFTKEAFIPQSLTQEVLVWYFEALNKQDYATAFSYLSDDMKAEFAKDADGKAVDALANFQAVQEEGIECVQVTDLKPVPDEKFCPLVSASLGIQCYQVVWEGKTKVTAAGSKYEIPTYYVVQADPHMDKDEAVAGAITNMAVSL